MLNSRISKTLFPQILKLGRNFNTPLLSVRTFIKKDGDPSAFAFVVSAKTAAKATERNFLKRRGRHAVRKNLDKIKDGYYCAFFFKKGLIKLPFPAFEQEILNGLKQAGLVI